MPILAAVIGGVAGVGGSLGSTVWQIDQARKSAHQQQDFEQDMSSTAYQRATADMKAAGLNPMLAYTQGGATTPGVQQQQVQQVPNLASSAIGAAQQVADVKQTGADTEKSVADARNANASAAATEFQVGNLMEIMKRKMGSEADSAEYKKYRDFMDWMEQRIKFTGGKDEFDTSPTVNTAGPFGNVFDRAMQEWRRLVGEQRGVTAGAKGQELSLSEKQAVSDWWKKHTDLGPWAREAAPYANSASHLIGDLMKRGGGM